MPARHVRTLRLRAPTEAHVRRGVVLLTDALRTASVRGDDRPGRVLIVRALRVGTIRPGDSPASVALVIEGALWRLAAQAVWADDPRADVADVVEFADDAEPRIALAARLALGAPVDAWFWPMAVPAWHPGLGRAGGLRAVLLDSGSAEAAPNTTAALVDALCQRGIADALLGSVSSEDGPALLEAFRPGLSSRVEEVREFPVPSPTEIPPTWLPVLTRWVGAWGPDDLRSLWLVLLALVRERPARRLDPTLAARASLLVRVLSPRLSLAPLAAPQRAPQWIDSDAGVATTAGLPDPTGDTVGDSGPEVTEPPPRSRQGEAGVPLPGLPRRTGRVPQGPSDLAATSESAGRAPSPVPTAWSDHAGLFFLVPLLEGLGIESWLEEHTELIEWAFPERFLHHVADRLGVAWDDPARAAASRFPTDDRDPAFVSPAAWLDLVDGRGPWCVGRPRIGSRARVLSDGVGRLPLALWYGRAPRRVRDLVAGRRVRRHDSRSIAEAVVVRAWFLAVNRACRRRARLGVANLGRRPGRVIATRTHLDVIFPLGQADVRIRRAGLDLDPGWVPWLGRVVRYHYQ